MKASSPGRENKNKTLIITTWFPTKKEPVSGLFNMFDAELLAERNEVTVWHLCAKNSEAIASAPNNIKIVRVPFSFKNPFSYLRLAKKVRKKQINFKLLHTMAFPALIALLFCKINIPWVHTEHYSKLLHEDKTVYALAIKVFNKLFKKPEQLVTVSQNLKNNLIKRTGTAQNITVIYNHVVFPEKLPNNKKSFNQKPLKLVAVGGLIERKGPQFIVEIVKELEKNGNDVTFTWVGEGELKQQLAAEIKSAGLNKKIFLPGTKRPEEVSQLLLNSDMFVLPVAYETFGVAIAEALAHGLPVITSGEGGHLDFLPDFAARVTARNAKDFVAAINSFKNGWSRNEISDYAKTIFSDQERATKYVKVYEDAQSAYFGQAYSGQSRKEKQ